MILYAYSQYLPETLVDYSSSYLLQDLDDVQEGFDLMARLDAHDDQLLHAKWLPSLNTDDPCSLNCFIVAVGAAGQLHLFDSSGARLISHPAGHEALVQGRLRASKQHNRA